MTALIGALVLAIWAYLLAAHGGFWRAQERDDRDESPEPDRWPSVVAIVPARDEADVIARSIGSLLAQDYPGPFRVILVDDNSSDGTGEIARRLDGHGRLEVITGAPLPAGWTGKIWAQSQGVARASAAAPDYLLLTDADIAHAPETLRMLVGRAEAHGLVLTSLMAKLTVETWPERLLIPAFVFFFAMLYPFAWVNDPRRRTAAAAGGVMLAKRTALEAAGGLQAIRWKIIDDCSLAALMKRQGPIWLGLTNRARSLRPYANLREIGRMVSRSAYAQLNFSPWLLIGTVAGMAIVYLAAPVLALFGAGLAGWTGIGAWAAMTLAFQPMLRFYGRSPLWGLALPLIAAIYTAFTLKSALDSWRGRGGQWKGRAQALETVPLLPVRADARPVTPEMVNRLRDNPSE
ncbi:MAG: glycosyltransferase [Caulobacteraceae bacterium]|nr:glycosyltransferase [Caulobacteraceae bacterium]